MRTKPIVVETARSPVPSMNSLNCSSDGVFSGLRPSRAVRESSAQALRAFDEILYLRTVRPAAGRTAYRPTSSSEIGMPNRVRNSRSSCSFIFFC